MGCDIHALVERKTNYGWRDSGDPGIGRDYEMFAVLAGMRNYDEITPISEPRGLPKGYPDRPCLQMEMWSEQYGEDGHSHSWLTLAEIKAFDTTQIVNDRSLIVGRNEQGAVTATARWSSVETWGPVGERRVLTWPGEDELTGWLRLIAFMERAKVADQSDDEIRLVFFFDN